MRTPLPSLIGESPAFLDTLARVSLVAQIDRPLLVIGERGTGKELIAERIHYLSGRWDGPFVKVNCAALSEDLLDSTPVIHRSMKEVEYALQPQVNLTLLLRLILPK